MRMEQYLTHTDYAHWEVIVNGDAPAIASASAGTEGSIPPKTVEQKLARKNELKAKSTLLLAIPDEHLLKFHGIKDAKTLWEAIKARFGGNKESKKMQKTILKQQYENFAASRSEGLDKTYDRNKSDLDTLSMDDLYNNLKVYESEIKVQSSSSSNSQNVAFVSSENTSSTNEAVNTAHEVSTASSQGQASSSTYADDVMFSFFANQSNSPQLDNEDLEQIDTDDLEEMDLKWNFVPIAVVTKSGQVLVNTAKQSSPRAAASISTARPVNTAAPNTKVNDALPTTYSYFKAHSPLVLLWDMRKMLLSLQHAEFGDQQEMLLTIPPKTVDHTCLKDLTMLIYKADSNYQEVDGGFVAFAGSPKGGKITGIGFPSKLFENDHTCVACQKGKQHKASCKTKLVSSISQPLQILHMDLFGPTSVRSVNHKTYYLVVTDDYTRFSWVFFLATKDETSGILKTFITGIENQINHKVNIIRCDNGTEFQNNDMNQFCGMKGIKREFSAEAVSTASYVQNRVLVTKPHNKTPYELLHGRPPSISFMRPFGCHVTILNTLDPLGKFDGKADVGFFVGYSINSKAFRVFNTRTRKVEKNLHITFLENKPNFTRSGPDWLFDIDSLTNSMIYEPVTVGNQTKRMQSSKDAVGDDASKKTNEEPANEGELDNLLVQQKEGYTNSTNRDSTVSPSVSTAGQSFTNADDLPTDPRMPDLEDTTDLLNTGIFSGAYDDEDVGAEADLNNLETIMNVSLIPTTRIHKDHPKDQIIGDINSATQTRRITKISEELSMKVTQALTNPRWIEAMQDELLQFSLQKVWRLVDLPKGKHAIGTKWVYRNKKDERGIVVRNKARLVAQGYTQEERIDYDEVFALVARIEAIRLFLSYASFIGFIVYQMDVKSAFLYGTIEEEVYVCQPPGFEDPKFPDKVYKVEKALYGLHQATRAWYETLSTYLLENRFRRGTIDKTLFIKKDKGDILLVQVYVDDIIFGSTKKSLCTEFESLMHKKFQMSSMGELTFFLRLQVMQRSNVIFISQDKYVADILKKFDFATVKTASTPIETNKALLKDEEAEDVDVHLYRSMIGSLMYLIASRPDIMFAVCACARNSPFDLEAFSDSDYVGASLDRKSTTKGVMGSKSNA
ncbi:putative ribonuclease H-like domain-containing protein [Tanacetum coccineum]